MHTYLLKKKLVSEHLTKILQREREREERADKKKKENQISLANDTGCINPRHCYTALIFQSIHDTSLQSCCLVKLKRNGWNIAKMTVMLDGCRSNYIMLAGK